MQFRLKFEGRIGGQGTKDSEKNLIRQYFHSQLLSVWNEVPLKDYHEYLRYPLPNKPLGFYHDVADLVFCPLINDRWRLLARLDILFLRREPPGNIFSKTGDIDNRVKVLIDALRMPTKDEIICAKPVCEQGAPMYCLLQDDKLVESFSVTTDQLHTAGHRETVEIIVLVLVRASYLTLENVTLAA